VAKTGNAVSIWSSEEDVTRTPIRIVEGRRITISCNESVVKVGEEESGVEKIGNEDEANCDLHPDRIPEQCQLNIVGKSGRRTS
jgi:hypothetical protein